MGYKHDYKSLLRGIDISRFRTKAVLARFLGLPRKTLDNAIIRGDVNFHEKIQPVKGNPLVEPSFKIPDIGKVTVSESGYRVLFITDPHFGFTYYEDQAFFKAIHDRSFLLGILSICHANQINEIVWGGDMLDFAEFGRYRLAESQKGFVQLAIYELVYMLTLFAALVPKQTILSGNHDNRLKNYLEDKAPNIVQMQSDDGVPLFSLTQIVKSLNHLGVTWIDKYPYDYWIGDTRFIHGNTVAGASGATAERIARNSTHNCFFGHIHKHEIIKKTIMDTGKVITVGCPGMALVTPHCPGAEKIMNWHKGAFLIGFDDEKKENQFLRLVDNVELPKHDIDNYLHSFMDSLRNSVIRRFGAINILES